LSKKWLGTRSFRTCIQYTTARNKKQDSAEVLGRIELGPQVGMVFFAKQSVEMPSKQHYQSIGRGLVADGLRRI
jgi:hypothetical protein